MKNFRILKVTFSIFALLFVFNISLLPAFAAEGDNFQAVTGATSDNPSASAYSLVPPCTGEKEECTWADLINLANRIVTFLVWLSASLAVMAFCYAGFLYMTAFGEMGKVEQAHSIFKSALVGVFFVLCGWLIIATILKVIGADPNVVNTLDFSKVQEIKGQPR